MTTEAEVYSNLDVYDIGVLLGRMMVDLQVNKKYDRETTDRMVSEATIRDLLNVRSEWVSEKGAEFRAKYRGARSLLEEAHNTPEKLGEAPILRQSRAYQEWKEHQ